MLGNLDNWLEKALAYADKKGFEPSVLLESRLAPDMYPLMRQIQAACDGAKFLAARLAGKEPPKHPDTERTFEEARTRIRVVREYLGSFGIADFPEQEAHLIPLPFLPGKGLTTPDFRQQMNLPNTYFHLCMAYAILRHNGVDLTKTDYIGALDLKAL